MKHDDVPFGFSAILQCRRCSRTVTKAALNALPEAAAPACPACGGKLAPYEPSKNKVGTDQTDMFWQFFAGGLGWLVLAVLLLIAMG